MERRDFLQSLVAAGAPVKERATRKNRLAHHRNEMIYRGPMAIPARIAEIIAEHPSIKRTTHRQLVSRYAGDADGWVWLFRCQIPEHQLMVGEIVRTEAGTIRVHCWSAADPERYTRGVDPAIIVATKEARATVDVLPPPPIRPDKMPLMAPQPPEWQDEYSEYVDPAEAERLMAEALREVDFVSPHHGPVLPPLVGPK